MEDKPDFSPGDLVVAYSKYNAVVLGAIPDENGVEWFYRVATEGDRKMIVGEGNLKFYEPRIRQCRSLENN